MTAPNRPAPARTRRRGGAAPPLAPDSTPGTDATAQPTPATPAVTSSQRRATVGPRAGRSPRPCRTRRAAPSTSPPATTTASLPSGSTPAWCSASAVRAAPAAAVMPIASATAQADAQPGSCRPAARPGWIRVTSLLLLGSAIVATFRGAVRPQLGPQPSGVRASQAPAGTHQHHQADDGEDRARHEVGPPGRGGGGGGDRRAPPRPGGARPATGRRTA